MQHDPEPGNGDTAAAGRAAEDDLEPAAHGWWAPRGDGTPGRLDVWYATVTDRETGTGLWVHGEVVTPATEDGADGPWPVGAGAVAHGWAALFCEGEEPVWARSVRSVHDEGASDPDLPPGLHTPALRIDAGGTAGTAGALSWELRWDASEQVPLATFPRWAWDRGVLPAAQVVPAPDLEVSGWVSRDGERNAIEGHGQVGRVFGHGNAQRWAWLHADLGDGALVELVTATPRRRALRRLPPITFLRLRADGVDWPTPRLACWGLRAELDLPRWTVRGRTQGVEVDIEVHQPAQRCVSVEYTDPDGGTATCTNSERADVEVRLRSQDGGERRWSVRGTAHAEVGRRP